MCIKSIGTSVQLLLNDFKKQTYKTVSTQKDLYFPTSAAGIVVR